MAINTMLDKGLCRVAFRLAQGPPRTFDVKKSQGTSKGEVPKFEPYEESLPLQSGMYSFVIDENGFFRIKRSHTSSHASMVSRQPITCAGRFKVSRMGQVIEVYCESTDYPLYFKEKSGPLITYVVKSFTENMALNTHPAALFRFKRWKANSFHLDPNLKPISDVDGRIDELTNEGVLGEVQLSQSSSYDSYVPEKPAKLYCMQLDQEVCSLEDDGTTDDDGFQYGPPEPKVSPTRLMPIGKLNFVIDQNGFLIVGPIGHQLLSGGQLVAGAGHVTIESNGLISQIDLNFSGHYRPPLTGDYACYVYRIFANHPLLNLAPGCKFAGRKFEGLDARSRILSFSESEMKGENPDMDLEIESY